MITGTGRLRLMDNEAAATGSPLPDRNLEPGPVQPSDDVRKELQGYLAADSSRIGEMYRLLEEGLTADAIAGRLEGGAAGAWQYRRMVRALLDGVLPTAPTVALAAARRYRTVLKAPALSAAACSYLQANLDELERRASDPARLDEEVQRASMHTQQAEARNEAGVYVYALPHLPDQRSLGGTRRVSLPSPPGCRRPQPHLAGCWNGRSFFEVEEPCPARFSAGTADEVARRLTDLGAAAFGGQDQERVMAAIVLTSAGQ